MGNAQRTSVNNFRYPSGNVYTGDMVSGKRDGQGTLTWPDGGSYTGMWRDDQCEGEGRMVFPNGSVYEGTFTRNNMHGEGKLKTVAGEVLQGFWNHTGRAPGFATPVLKFTFHGEIADGSKRVPYDGPLALYMNSGLVSLPNMRDPSEALLPYAVAMADGPADPQDPKLAEEGRVLFKEGMETGAVPVAVPVDSAYAGKTVVYGAHEPAFTEKHQDEHASYDLLDPKLYLSALGFRVAPTNTNKAREDALRQARTGNTGGVPVQSNPAAFNIN